ISVKFILWFVFLSLKFENLVSSLRLEMQLKSGRAASKRGGSPKDKHSQSETGNETISKSLY
ncbi:hypothetical protein, partial [Nostoc sp.]